MKKYLLIVFCLLTIQTVFCQKQKATPCNTYECIINKIKASLKEKTNKEYQKLLANLEDAESYLSDKQKDYSQKRQEIRNLRLEVFKAIEGEKQKAILAEKKALQKTKEAQIATNNARATYWYSEGSKYAPTQKLRLWLEAIAIPHLSADIRKSLEDGIIETVKQSDTHQWHEKKRFSNVKAFISDDSKWIGTIDENAKAEVWDIEKVVPNNYLKKEKIHKVSFSPNSQWLVATDTLSHTHKIWDVNKGIKNHEFKYEFTDSDEPLSKYFSKDGRFFEEKTRNNRSKIWDLENQNYLFSQLQLSDVSFSGDSEWIAIITSNKEAKLWNVKSNVDIQECEIDYLKGKSIEDISFSPNNQWLITKDKSGKAKVWSLINYKIPSFLDGQTIYVPYFSPNDKWLVTRDTPDKDKCTSKIWDMSNGNIILKNTLPDVEFSPDNQWLVNKQKLTGDYYQLNVLDINQKSWEPFLQNEKDIYKYSFSPNSKWLVTNHNNVSKIWDLTTGQLYKFSKDSPKFPIVKIEVSNDCQWILIIDSHDNAKIWNTQKEKWYDFLQGERDISIAKFFANNELLLTKDDFGIVKIWTLSSKGNDANETKKAFEKIENANDINEIQKWMKDYGDKYLLPNEQQIYDKYIKPSQK